MFYIICDGKYLASKGMLVESKRAAYPYRTYQEAKEYRLQAVKVHKLTGLKIVLR
jgi:DNA-binding transcriptional MerR regulator